MHAQKQIMSRLDPSRPYLPVLNDFFRRRREVLRLFVCYAVHLDGWGGGGCSKRKRSISHTIHNKKSSLPFSKIFESTQISRILKMEY